MPPLNRTLATTANGNTQPPATREVDTMARRQSRPAGSTDPETVRQRESSSCPNVPCERRHGPAERPSTDTERQPL